MVLLLPVELEMLNYYKNFWIMVYVRSHASLKWLSQYPCEEEISNSKSLMSISVIVIPLRSIEIH
jgi:hypothetical protein